MLRERIACAYPGRRKVGLSLWLVEDQTIVETAVGSVETSAVGGVLERFHPDLLVVEPGRPGDVRPASFRASARDFTFIHPSWRSERRRQPLGPVGHLAQNAWRMGFWHLIRRGKYRIGVLRIRALTREWLTKNDRPRRTRES